MEEKQNQTRPESDQGAAQTAAAFVWDLVKIFLIAFIIIIPFRTFVAEPFVVSGSSMVPNFHNHDYLIIDRLSYLLLGQPKRGDVIVLKFPKDTSQYFIKRIIGLPGDKVCFSPNCQGQDGHVYIFNSQHPDGVELNEPYISQPTYGQSMIAPLSDNQYFVLGDNRTASSDSRVWGILPKNDIVGRVWTRIYPFADAGFIKTPAY